MADALSVRLLTSRWSCGSWAACRRLRQLVPAGLLLALVPRRPSRRWSPRRSAGRRLPSLAGGYVPGSLAVAALPWSRTRRVAALLLPMAFRPSTSATPAAIWSACPGPSRAAHAATPRPAADPLMTAHGPERYRRRPEPGPRWRGFGRRTPAESPATATHSPTRRTCSCCRSASVRCWRLLGGTALFPLAPAVLDVGCGGGAVASRSGAVGRERRRVCAAWTCSPTVLRRHAGSCAPDVTLASGERDRVAFRDGTFDLVLQSTVFTSMLDPAVRRAAAGEIAPVLRPGGAVLWYDYYYDNPRNPDVRRVRRAELEALFPGCRRGDRRVTLAPPLTRALAARAWSCARARRGAVAPHPLPRPDLEAVTAAEVVAKRACDLALVGPGLVLLSPLLVLAAAAVGLSSPGPSCFGKRASGATSDRSGS